jgi:hypothetical protein
MLADNFNRLDRIGALNREVQLPTSALHALIDFIANELARWRDDPQRPVKTAENDLTDQLCAYLNSTARNSSGWDHYQFRTEVADETKKGRKIDLVASPCGAVIWIDGRRCLQYDTLLPIECKRLPTPNSKDRDEREYVVNRSATTGGMQRFKEGNHGAKHLLAAMIAYIQDESIETWFGRINNWLAQLAQSNAAWNQSDLLRIESNCAQFGLAKYQSMHTRAGNLGAIELRHLWLDMQSKK